MFLDVPIPPSWTRELGPAPAQVAEASAPAPAPANGQPAASDESGRATYYLPIAGSEAAAGEPVLLMVSPMLPLSSSLPALIEEAVKSEPDFQIEWRWPVFLARVGPWELVMLMVVGRSAEAGVTTGRIYAAFDAGYGTFLVVLLDRDPNRLAARKTELCELLARARLRRSSRENPTGAGLAQPEEDSLGALGALSDDKWLEELAVPPQLPPLSLYLKDALYKYLTD